MGGYCYAFFCTGMLPALDIYTQQWVTQRNGFLLNFSIALRYSSVDRPENYSKDLVLELMEEHHQGLDVLLGHRRRDRYHRV